MEMGQTQSMQRVSSVVEFLHELVKKLFPHLNAGWDHIVENVHWSTLSHKKSSY